MRSQPLTWVNLRRRNASTRSFIPGLPRCVAAVSLCPRAAGQPAPETRFQRRSFVSRPRMDEGRTDILPGAWLSLQGEWSLAPFKRCKKPASRSQRAMEDSPGWGQASPASIYYVFHEDSASFEQMESRRARSGSTSIHQLMPLFSLLMRRASWRAMFTPASSLGIPSATASTRRQAASCRRSPQPPILDARSRSNRRL